MSLCLHVFGLLFCFVVCDLVVNCWRLLTHRTQRGWTALIIAVVYGRADCVRLLIDAGADKDARTKVSISLFHHRCSRRQFDTRSLYFDFVLNSHI